MKSDKTINVKKPWGQEFHFVYNKTATVKILEVNPSQKLSYQSHKKRSEFWRCIKNNVLVILNDKEIALNEGEEIHIPKGAKHRLVGSNKTGQVLEIISGKYEDEDIVRYSDDFGRKGTTKV